MTFIPFCANAASPRWIFVEVRPHHLSTKLWRYLMRLNVGCIFLLSKLATSPATAINEYPACCQEYDRASIR